MTEIVPTIAKTKGATQSTLRTVTRAKGTRRNPLLTVLLAVLAVLWMVPVLGLLITSFRDTTAAQTNGWWTVFTNPVARRGRVRITVRRFPDPPAGQDRASRRSS